MKKIFLLAAMSLIMTGCYKFKLTNTSHPDKGEVKVSVSLPTMGDGETAPARGYTVVANGQSVAVGEDGKATFPELLEPGVYYMYVYSNSDGVTLEDNTAQGGDIIAKAAVADGVVESLKENVYFGIKKITVVADAVIDTDISMSKISRDIRFSLKVAEGDPERISKITATLSGMTSEWNCTLDEVYSSSKTIAPSFTLGESLVKSADNNYLVSSIRVLGINDIRQVLTLNLTYSDGKTQTITSDISDQLKYANDDKTKTITLTGDVNTPIESGVEGTITNWEQINGGNQTVN